MKLSTFFSILITIILIGWLIENIINQYRNLQNTNSIYNTIVITTVILILSITVVYQFCKIPIKLSLNE
jgi:hypothetical protein